MRLFKFIIERLGEQLTYFVDKSVAKIVWGEPSTGKGAIQYDDSVEDTAGHGGGRVICVSKVSLGFVAVDI